MSLIQQALQQVEQETAVLPEDDYTLEITGVKTIKNGRALRPICRVIGGPHDGEVAMPGLYDFSGKGGQAMMNVFAWGVTQAQIEDLATNGGFDVEAVGEMLVGRRGRVHLGVFEAGDGRAVNSHLPGRVELLPEASGS